MIPNRILRKLPARLDLIKSWRYRKLSTIELEYAETKEHFRTPPKLKYRKATLGQYYGTNWGTTWFRGRITIPKDCRGRRVYYQMNSAAEKLVFINGQPFAGLDKEHHECLLAGPARGGERFQIHVEAYAGHPLNVWAHHRNERVNQVEHTVSPEWPKPEPLIRLASSALLVERPQISAFYYDAQVLYETALILNKNTHRHAELLDKVNQAIDRIPMHWEDEEELEQAAAAARKMLAPLLKQKNSESAPRIDMVSHAHIDIAWLWPLEESKRKAARSFSTLLRLMEDYPELTFIQSQPILYQFIEDHYPEMLPQIQALVKRGTWEPNGGMWVESDTNVPSGESLIRQFIEGRKKTMELFGKYGDTLWLPDVFGYSAAMPQIMRGCEIDYFVTAKLRGNDTNHPPHDTFDWVGIDGSSVLTHLILAKNAYNDIINPENMVDRWNRVRHKEVSKRALASVGYGDGGGGITREQVETARRMRDLDGCPRCEFTTVSKFLQTLDEEAQPRPYWVGELYYERHRGTYTTQALTKWFNRKLEFLLREVEWLATMAMALGETYPAEELQAHWRMLLTNQFHDIIPGSSIRPVYELAEAEYAESWNALQKMRTGLLRKLAATVAKPRGGRAYIIENSLAWEREDVVTIEDAKATAAIGANGEALPVQRLDARRLAVAAPAGPMSLSAIALKNSGGETAQSSFKYNENARTLSTPHYRVRFDKAGRISSLIDRAAGNREVAQKGRALNYFYTAEDIPVACDAWDIDKFYRDKVVEEDRLLEREVIADGPLMFVIRSKYAIGRASTLSQEMIFHARSRRIDFRTEVEWREVHQLLKVGFPVEIHADHYRNEIQFGHVVRPTHENTSWEEAKFEICAHRWVDISEGDYGVSLLNDCKYGHDSLDRMISLTLLKAAWAPDEQADQGHHEFTYALLPHGGDWSVETTVRAGYELNVPLTVEPMRGAGAGETQTAGPFCTVDNPNVILETVKKAEASDAVIVRCYEAGRTRGPVTLEFARPIAKASECNMLERHDSALKPKGRKLTFEIKPFEVKTLKLKLK